MCLALAAFNDRIAALFETANRFVFVDLPLMEPPELKSVPVVTQTLAGMLKQIQENNTTILICGAIHKGMAWNLISAGIQVVPWITGDVTTILTAFQKDALENYVMPGCWKGFQRGKRWRRGWPENWGTDLPPQFGTTGRKGNRKGGSRKHG